MSERQPGTANDEDPREQGTGEGYPESNPEGTTPVEGSQQGPEAGPSGEHEDAADVHRRAPSTSGGQDAPPSSATGNPGAAGG